MGTGGLALRFAVCSLAAVLVGGAASAQARLELRAFFHTGIRLGDVRWTGREFIYVEETTGTILFSGERGAGLHVFARLPSEVEEFRCRPSPGLHGYPQGVVYCHSPGNAIYEIDRRGHVSLFARLPENDVSDGALTFDTRGRFGYRMLAATGRSGTGTGGNVYSIRPGGKVRLIGSYPGPGGAENMAVALGRFGRASGDVLISIDWVANSGRVVAIGPNGRTFTIADGLGDGINPIAVVGNGGRARTRKPRPGFYVSDTNSTDVFFAPARQLRAYEGGIVVGAEKTGRFWAIQASGGGVSRERAQDESSRCRLQLRRRHLGIRAISFSPIVPPTRTAERSYTRDSLLRMTDPNHTVWSDEMLDRLHVEFAPVYGGRTVLVTGADGFMGSHLTEALVLLGARVHAFVRATSSGALNNIAHLRRRMKVHFADLTDRTSVDYLVKELLAAEDRPYVFHLAAQAHVGESWHRPYETVMANTVGTLNLLQSIVDHGLELEKLDTAGTSEEYGNVREPVQHHHDFDEHGGLILHERSPINPKSIYATSKVAADFLTMNYHDAFGLPGLVTRMFNNYGPRQNPRYVTGTVITQALERQQVELGQLEPMRDFCFCSDGVRGHLMVAAHGIPGDLYVYGQGKNIAIRDWANLILEIGEAEGYWVGREIVSVPARFRPGASEVMALRVGYEKLKRETGWEPLVSWEEGISRTIEWYAASRDRWIGRVDWLVAEREPAA